MIKLGHIRVQIGYTESGEPPEDGEMNQMTLLSRFAICIQLAIWGQLGLRYLFFTEAPHNIES